MTQLALIDLSQLRQLLAEVKAEPQPALLDRQSLAKALAVSAATVDRLRREGMPAVNVGDASPRFELDAVLSWLKVRGN